MLFIPPYQQSTIILQELKFTLYAGFSWSNLGGVVFGTLGGFGGFLPPNSFGTSAVPIAPIMAPTIPPIRPPPPPFPPLMPAIFLVIP